MENGALSQRQHIMENLADMPGKIILLHGQENLAEFVLHNLCHKDCFNLKKAAYFIDNPDFDHLKGIAGYDAQECFAHDSQACWLNPEEFTRHMQSAHFNQRVRSMNSASSKRKQHEDSYIVKTIANELELNNPAYCCWNLKNDNHGLLVFEHGNGIACAWEPKDLERGLHLLSFCPVF